VEQNPEPQIEFIRQIDDLLPERRRLERTDDNTEVRKRNKPRRNERKFFDGKSWDGCSRG
jgi:hypothetical protein